MRLVEAYDSLKDGMGGQEGEERGRRSVVSRHRKGGLRGRGVVKKGGAWEPC